MKRRKVLQLGVMAAAAPVFLPGQSTAWKPAVFNAHQDATVIALSDLIIPATDTPGAKAVEAHRYIDLLLADAPPERTRFLNGLGWLDTYAQSKYEKAFVDCTPANQTAILEALDAGGSGELALGNQFFRLVKSITTRVYYNTAEGYRELNKGGRVPAGIGCQHPPHA